MLQRFINLFKQDLLVAYRNKFHIVIIVLAVLMALVVNYVIPEEVKLTPTEIFLDKTEGQLMKDLMLRNEVDEDRFVKSKEELYERLESNSNTLGVIIEGNLEKINYTLVGQGNESEESFNLLDAAMDYALKMIRNSDYQSKYRIERLRGQSPAVPFNKKMIPIFIFTEVILLGFLLIAVMVFQEKNEGSVRAYRVSPGGTLEYILSKVGTNLVLALIYAHVLILLTIGTGFNILNLFSVIVLANIVMTLLGLSVSVFFKSLEEFIFVAIFIMSVLSLAMMSYLTPSFAPDYIKILPSYPVLFGLREILFPVGRTEFVTSLNWNLLIEVIIMLGISLVLVKRKLMKEGN